MLGAAILAGGSSLRMGTNKALLRPHPAAPTLIELVVARLADAGLPHPVLVTNSPGDYAFLGLSCVADAAPGAGPLGGILSALLYSPHSRVLVVACDMPSLNPSLLRFMASVPTCAAAIVPRLSDAAGKLQPEPLHAIYARSCIEPIRKHIAAGHLKAGGLFADVDVRWIDEPELRQHDPVLHSFRNANTPQDWAALRAAMHDI